MLVLEAIVGIVADALFGKPKPVTDWNDDEQGNSLATVDPDPDPDINHNAKAYEVIAEFFDLIRRPTVMREEQADNWLVTVHELEANQAVRICEVNPNRMLMELNRVPATSDPVFRSSMNTVVRVGPSQPSVTSAKTSTVVNSGWSSNVVSDIWVWADTAINLEVVEYFRSGNLIGHPRR